MKMVGELDAGNPHVQFDEGVQETCDSATRLCPTLPKPLASGLSLRDRYHVTILLRGSEYFHLNGFAVF